MIHVFEVFLKTAHVNILNQKIVLFGKRSIIRVMLSVSI